MTNVMLRAGKVLCSFICFSLQNGKKEQRVGGRERGINNINFELLTVMSVCNSLKEMKRELYTKVSPSYMFVRQ